MFNLLGCLRIECTQFLDYHTLAWIKAWKVWLHKLELPCMEPLSHQLISWVNSSNPHFLLIALWIRPQSYIFYSNNLITIIFRVSRRKCVSQSGRVRFADGPGGGRGERLPFEWKGGRGWGDCRSNEREKTGGNTANIANKNKKRSYTNIKNLHILSWPNATQLLLPKTGKKAYFVWLRKLLLAYQCHYLTKAPVSRLTCKLIRL